jgi:hypothetical protein
MKTLLLLLAASLVSVPALADCTYPHEGNVDPAAISVPDWSYQMSFRSEDPTLDMCARQAEDIDCEAEGLYGLECAEKMQRIYSACIGHEVCSDLVDGLLEDMHVVGSGVGQAYGACLDLVTAAGGNGR